MLDLKLERSYHIISSIWYTEHRNAFLKRPSLFRLILFLTKEGNYVSSPELLFFDTILFSFFFGLNASWFHY